MALLKTRKATSGATLSAEDNDVILVGDGATTWTFSNGCDREHQVTNGRVHCGHCAPAHRATVKTDSLGAALNEAGQREQAARQAVTEAEAEVDQLAAEGADLTAATSRLANLRMRATAAREELTARQSARQRAAAEQTKATHQAKAGAALEDRAAAAERLTAGAARIGAVLNELKRTIAEQETAEAAYYAAQREAAGRSRSAGLAEPQPDNFRPHLGNLRAKYWWLEAIHPAHKPPYAGKAIPDP